MTLEGKRILLADDEPRFREACEQLFAEEGVHLELACDGEEALHKATLGQPDIILMDLYMPRTNGFEAIRALRILMADKPILVLTGYDVEENLQSAREAGATECLTKPISLPVLRETIERLIAEA